METVAPSLLTGLTSGQQAASRLILESTDRFVAIQGYAGVGKPHSFAVSWLRWKPCLKLTDRLWWGWHPRTGPSVKCRAWG